MAAPAHAGIQSVGSPAAAALQTLRFDPAGAWNSPFTLASMQQQPASDPPKSVDVDIDVNRHEGRAWYLNPVWMAIGGLGLALVIILIVMAARGGSGGTTVVRS
jgi:hypothetical protein